MQGPDDGFRAAKVLRDFGVRNALIKLKDGGCAVGAEGDCFLVEAPPVEPVDKTGAGDAFAGALAVALLRGLTLAEAARTAVAAASIAVTRYGAQASYPDHVELARMLQRVSQPRRPHRPAQGHSQKLFE